jgi:O-antigen ligase
VTHTADETTSRGGVALPTGHRVAQTANLVVIREEDPRQQRGFRLAFAALVLCSAAVTGVLGATAGPGAAILVLGGAVAAACAVWAPGYLLGAYLVIAFYKGALQTYSPVDITVLLAIPNALQIVPVLLSRRERRVSLMAIALLMTLSFLIIGSVLYAPDQSLALANAANWWALVLLPIVPAAVRVGSDRRYVSEMLWVFFGIGVLVVALGVTQLSSIDRLVVLDENTLQVAYAALLVPLVGVSFVLRQRSPSLRALTIVLIPAAIVSAVASGSRGPIAIFALMATVSVLAYALEPTHRQRRISGLVGGSVAIAVVLAVAGGGIVSTLPSLSIERFTLFGDFVQSGISGELNPTTGDVSSQERLTLFGLAVSLFEDHPILGVGSAGFAALSPRFLNATEADVYPHDSVLQFAAEYGVVGLVLFAWLIWVGMRRRLAPNNPTRAVRIVFVFFLLNSLLSGDIFSYRELWGTLIVVLLVEDHAAAPTARTQAPSARRSSAPMPTAVA